MKFFFAFFRCTETGYNVSHFFSINNATGDVNLLEDIDREKTGDTILVSLMVTDEGEPPKSGTSSLNITVLDINDNVPQFNQSIFEITIWKVKSQFIFEQIYIMNKVHKDIMRVTNLYKTFEHAFH